MSFFHIAVTVSEETRGNCMDVTKDQLQDFLLTNLPMGLLLVDEEFRIVEFNKEAERLTGWQRGEVIGKRCSQVLQSSLCETQCPLLQCVQEKRNSVQQEAFIITKWNERVPVFLSSSALLTEDKQFVTGFEIFRDATETKKLEAQKKNIVSIFVHDLKAPVSIAGGFLQRLLQGKAGRMTDKQHKYVTAIKREIDRLGSYIHHFLDVSRLESGQLQLIYGICDLNSMLRELAFDFQVKAMQKSIHIDYIADSRVSRVIADRVELERAVSNLLDNAIKYSSENSRIELKLKSVGDFILITVKDQGQGIAEDKLPYIFDYFFSLHEKDGEGTGFGLGLAAVKGIAEAHGGTIWAKSIRGEGSSFYMKIPHVTEKKHKIK